MLGSFVASSEKKNSEAPFAVKKAVWESALNASILYSCETWMTSSLKQAEQLYQHTLKDLVGVRYQIPTDLVYVETGIPPLTALVSHRQRKFLEKLQASSHFEGSPRGGRSLVPTSLATSFAYVTRRTPEGIYMLKQWEIPNFQNSMKNIFTFNADIKYGLS